MSGDADNAACPWRDDRVEDLHGLDDEQGLAGLDRVADIDEGVFAGRRGGMQNAKDRGMDWNGRCFRRRDFGR